MSNLKLVKSRPLFLDDIYHKMKMVKYFGRTEDEIRVEVEDIEDYPDSHHID